MRIEATNYALRHIPEDRIRYHTCWGSWHTPHTTDLPFRHVIDLMLKVKAQAYSVEAADVRHQLDWQLWEDVKLPEGKIYIPGVVAHKTTTIERIELVGSHRDLRPDHGARTCRRHRLRVRRGLSGHRLGKMRSVAEGAALASHSSGREAAELRQALEAGARRPLAVPSP